MPEMYHNLQNLINANKPSTRKSEGFRVNLYFGTICGYPAKCMYCNINAKDPMCVSFKKKILQLLSRKANPCIYISLALKLGMSPILPKRNEAMYNLIP